MKPSLKLHIPEPCHESWANMAPAAQGRFCSACSKTVIDFSAMNDSQVLEYFSNYTGNTCGRFQGDQLNRVIANEPKRSRGWLKYVLSMLVPAILIGSKASAQGGVKVATVCAPPDYKKTAIKLGRVAIKQPERKETVIRGIVKDKSGIPLQSATVMIKDTNRGAVTDNSGSFTLRHSMPGAITLEVSYVGFMMKEVQVDETYNSSSPIVMVKMLPGHVGAVVVVEVQSPTVFHEFKRFVADSLRKRFNIYPNPAKAGSVLNADIKLKKGNYFIRVIDLHGRLLQEESVQAESRLTNVSFNLYKNILPGHYTIMVLDNKKRKLGTQQVIVN